MPPKTFSTRTAVGHQRHANVLRAPTGIQQQRVSDGSANDRSSGGLSARGTRSPAPSFPGQHHYNNNNQNHNNNNFVGRRNNNNNVRNNNAATTYTTADLENRENKYSQVRTRRLEKTTPMIRQRQNELMEICCGTQRLVAEKHEECGGQEITLEARCADLEKSIGENLERIKEQRQRCDDARSREAQASTELSVAMKQHREEIEQCDAKQIEIKHVVKEIRTVNDRTQASKERTRKLIQQRESKKTDVETLRQELEKQEDDERLAHKILEEKQQVLVDIQQKIDTLKRRKEAAFGTQKKKKK